VGRPITSTCRTVCYVRFDCSVNPQTLAGPRKQQNSALQDNVPWKALTSASSYGEVWIDVAGRNVNGFDCS
jgi:hypothetical protein